MRFSLKPECTAQSLLFAAAFFSGLSALMMEILWARAFQLILGATVKSSAIALTACMLGIGIGAWWFGKMLVRQTNPKLMYIWLEVLIAISAPTIGIVMHDHADWLAQFLRSEIPSIWPPFLAACLLVGVPSFFIGGTFPVLCQWMRQRHISGDKVAILYAFNVAGAAVGSLFIGFVAIRLWGVTNSYCVAASFNVACVILAIMVKTPSVAAMKMDDRHKTATNQKVVPWGVLVTVSCVSGAAVFAMEMVYIQLASFFVGNRTFALSTLLFAVLVSLAVGAWLAARATRLRDCSLENKAILLLVVSIAALGLNMAMLSWWNQHQYGFELHYVSHQTLIFALFRLTQALAGVMLVLVPLGMLFPSVLIELRDSGTQSIRHIGMIYWLNMLGSMVGGLGIGYYAIAALGSFKTAMLVGGLLSVVALGLIIHQGCKHFTLRYWLHYGVAWTIAVSMIGFIPHQPLTVMERYSNTLTPLVVHEDEYGVFQLFTGSFDRRIWQFSNLDNNIGALKDRNTQYAQQIQAHAAMWYAPDAKRAVVIGNGYGITAGVLGRYATLESVDAVDVLKIMFDSADIFLPHNWNYHHNPKVHQYVTDGRYFLTTSNAKYDVIVISPTDAVSPQNALLYSRDFLEIAKRHLAPGGVVAIHAFGFLHGQMLHTFSQAFPYVKTFKTYPQWECHVAIGSMQPLKTHDKIIQSQLNDPAVLETLTNIGLNNAESIKAVLATAKSPQNNPLDFISPQGQISDDRPITEFYWMKGTELYFWDE